MLQRKCHNLIVLWKVSKKVFVCRVFVAMPRLARPWWMWPVSHLAHHHWWPTTHHQPFPGVFFFKLFLAGFSLAWEGLLEGPFPFSRHLFFFSLFSDWNQKRLGVWCQKITEFEFSSPPPAASWATIYLFTKSLGGDKTISWKECYTKHSKSHFEKT